MAKSNASVNVQPSLEEVRDIIDRSKAWSDAPNLVPICASISSEFLTPSAIYLKVAAS
jgi:anthranilate synthase component 1